MLSRVEPGELWIGDRNFATRGFLSGIAEREALFLIREHGNLPWEAAGLEESKGRAENGQFYEQPVVVEAPRGEESAEDRKLRLRRVRLVLDEPTRSGDTEIVVLTGVPACDASAKRVASLYRKRWRIKRAFQELSDHLEAEIETLSCRKAALFGFAVGFVSYNVLSVLESALASV